MNKSKSSGALSLVLFIILFLVGAGILFYPKISFWIAENNVVIAHQSYERTVGDLTTEEKEEMWAQAVYYNERLVRSTVKDPFATTEAIDPFDEYYQTLDIGDGEMGYIHIPAIDVMLPIYHGVSDEVLDKGVGHIKATALPIGGIDTHCVLTGHSGLSHAGMFDDLEKLKEEEEFFLQILDETLAYQISEIHVVLPDDISKLHREKGKDKVTLITCTPYGVNSHRLLVTGERIPFNAPMPTSQSEEKAEFPWWIVILVIAIIFFVILLGAVIRRASKKRASREQQ